VPTKIVLKVGFLERDFERDHLAEKSNRTKMGQKIHCAWGRFFVHFPDRVFVVVLGSASAYKICGDRWVT
jgi:hypothetical protein